jgi:hypothetical protein
MKTVILSVSAALALSVLVAAPSVIAQQRDKAGESSGHAKNDAQAACMAMMQGSGTTEEGRKAMQEFMQSPNAPQAMNNMMEMARRMGNGDTMLGMTKVMDMMGGGMSGMMGGQASPGMQRPK